MDKYDEAIEYLTENPIEIADAWGGPSKYPAGCLFNFCGIDDSSHTYGCLTQVRAGIMKAQTPELTAEIAADNRIPVHEYDITPADLPVFAEWQRRLDKELNRV